MDEFIEMLKTEIERAKRLHPEKMDVVRFLGVAGIKFTSIQAKCHHHAIEQFQNEANNARIDLIQIAAMCLRCLDDIGGIDPGIYAKHIKTSNGYKMIDHAKG